MQLPSRIGKYELIEALGGGMSEVYRALDSQIGRVVAIKILKAENSADAETRERFIQEARTAGGINHPNILTVYDFGHAEDGRPFLVMEFMRGEDLRKAIKGGRAGDPSKRARIALQTAGAIQHVHLLGITHRDIKPENVYLSETGIAKLMDFGIAKLEDVTRTKVGFAVGTPQYMAPEQWRGEKATNLMDIYAFGVLLSELFSGVLLAGSPWEAISYRTLHEPFDIKPLDDARAPDHIRSLVLRCTAQDPGKRPSSFEDICIILEKDPATPRGRKSPGTIVGEESRLETSGFAAGEWWTGLNETVRHAFSDPEKKKWAVTITATISLLVLLTVVLLISRHPEKRAPLHSATDTSARTLPAALQDSTGDMTLVPAGPFTAGSDENGADEKKQTVTLPAFYIDRTEVSNDVYRRFCETTHRALPRNFKPNAPELPVVGITIDDARAFAKWAGKRLPQKMEWEKTARGTDGRKFPWGDEADKRFANVSAKSLQSIEAFPAGQGPYGSLQLCGNVWELTESQTRADQRAKVVDYFSKLLGRNVSVDEPWAMIQGGAFDTPISYCATYESALVPAVFADANIGFRCAKDAQ